MVNIKKEIRSNKILYIFCYFFNGRRCFVKGNGETLKGTIIKGEN